MREIKFRGKRINNSEWTYGYYVQRSYKDCCVYHYIYTGSYFEDENQEGAELEIYEVDPKTVGQYIGFKDKNGKEIYKGDIVKDNDSRLSYLGNDKYEVVFEIKAWASEFRFRVLPHKKWAYGRHGKFLEVIDNIHDNPELMHVKEK